MNRDETAGTLRRVASGRIPTKWDSVLKLSARTAVATVAAVLVARLSGLAESYWAAIATPIG